jgi:hypothetical protein
MDKISNAGVDSKNYVCGVGKVANMADIDLASTGAEGRRPMITPRDRIAGQSGHCWEEHVLNG